MYRCRAFKAVIAIVLSLAVIASFLVIIPAADEIQSWITFYVRYSNDLTNWTSEYQYQLNPGAVYQQPTYKYAKVTKVQVLNTTNKPSDMFISFSLGVGWTNSTGASYDLDKTWTSSADFEGYFRSKYGGKFSDDLYNYNAAYFVGQYHIDDVNNTAFVLTADNCYWGSGGTGISIKVCSVNVCFIGNDNQLYDINENLISIQELLTDTYNQDNGFYDWFVNDFYDFFVNWFEGWEGYFDLWDGYSSYWYYYYIPRFNNIWTNLTQTNYSYLAFSGYNTAPNSFNTTNPFTALITSLNSLTRYQSRPLQSIYSYDFTSYNGDIGSMTRIDNTNWYSAVLGQLQALTAVEKHHMEIENAAISAGSADNGTQNPYEIYNEARPNGNYILNQGYAFETGITDPKTNLPITYTEGSTAISSWFSVLNNTWIYDYDFIYEPVRGHSEQPDYITISDLNNEGLFDWYGGDVNDVH